MNKKRLLIVILLALCFSITTFPANRETANAQDCRVVFIQGKHEIPRMEPDVLWISKDACVIWYNHAPESKVKIMFADGKKCQEVTKSPTGFELEAATNCYVTKLIPFGGTASLMFLQEGDYKYVLETPGGVKIPGEIVVH